MEAHHFDDSQLLHKPELIEENVDGEEESLLSQQSRVHGASILIRGTKQRESRPMTMLDLVTASENDTTSQVETNLGAFSGAGAFNSRQRVSEFNAVGAKKPQVPAMHWGAVANGDSGVEASSMTYTRGNDSG